MKYLVQVSGMHGVEFAELHEAIACEKDYKAAGHKATIYQLHEKDQLDSSKAFDAMLLGGMDPHVLETFGPVSSSTTNTVEADPHGTNPHAPGAKLDAGKNRLGLVLGGFSDALWEVGKVGTYGANKYTDDGWKSVPNARGRYLDALYRHLLRAQSGEIFDPDTQLLHLAHVAWNALAILHSEIVNEDIPF